MRTTILLVDDHPVFREGLRSLIDKSTTLLVVAEAGNGMEAIRLAAELKPDLVVMDLTMPIMNGIDATREITKNHPEIKVLVLSMESDRFFVVEALKAGAMGYLLKDTAFAELTDAITTVVNGETYLPKKISTLVVKEFLQCIPEEMAPVYQNLTLREREILQLLADGKCIKEIANLLDVSNKTVENQRHAIMQKLQLFSVAELTKFAVRHGLSSLTK
jgi:DNA-binding NarL/FixJ family response regulator